MRQTDDRGLDDAWQGVEFELYLFWINIVPASDDNVLAAPDDMQITALIEPSQIARDEKPVLAKLGLCLLRISPIAAEDIGSPDLDHADFAWRRSHASFRIGYSDLDARQGQANGPRDALA